MTQAARLASGLAALEAAGLVGGRARELGDIGDIGDIGEIGGVTDGQPLDDCPLLRPTDSEALARSLALLAEHGMSVLVRGGASRLEIGNPPAALHAVLDTRSLSGVDDFESEDGVVHVRAGTPLSLLRERVRAEGWVLRLDPAGQGATVGGTLAAAAMGPRVLGYGRPRDCVLGLDVVLASGERTSCGGRVVKNVTGYDMAKLYTGSFGTLGVIASAWLKLAPIPELEQVLAVRSSNFENMFAISLESSRRSTARAAALLSPQAARQLDGVPVESPEGSAAVRGGWVLVVELAGDERSTRSDASWLRELAARSQAEVVDVVSLAESAGADAADASAEALGRVRALQGGTLEAGGIRARIAALPTAQPAIVDATLDSCGSLVLYPGVGLVYAFSEGGHEAGIAAVDACSRAAERVAGSLVFEALPPAARRGRDVFGGSGPELALMRALKRRFDPDGVLNPGRFAGGI